MNGTRAEQSSQPAGERGVTRRQFLGRTGKTIAGTTALAATAGTAAAEYTPEDYATELPNHAEVIQDDTEWLEYYRPLLDTRDVPYTNRPKLYGWRITSRDDYPDVGVYVCEYGVQSDWTSLTSHSGDHEWIYVYVDPDTGDVIEVSYTAYHWLRGYVTNPPVDTSDGGAHPMFRIAAKYHNYVPMAEATDTMVQFDPDNLGDYSSRSGPLYQWIKNGMGEDMALGAVHNPWLLDSDGPLDAWWLRDGSLNSHLADAWAFLSFDVGIAIRGGEDADLGDREI